MNLSSFKITSFILRWARSLGSNERFIIILASLTLVKGNNRITNTFPRLHTSSGKRHLTSTILWFYFSTERLPSSRPETVIMFSILRYKELKAWQLFVTTCENFWKNYTTARGPRPTIQLKQKENKNRITIMLNHKDHCLSIEPLRTLKLSICHVACRNFTP